MKRMTPKQLRENLQLTQAKAADAMGISRSYYNEIENGERVPSYKMARRIADFFKVRMDDIVFPAFEYADRKPVEKRHSSSQAASSA